MLTTLVFVVAFIIVALLVYMARYSGRLRVEEKRVIAAPISDVYAKVADFRTWPEWCPWLEHEREAPVRISGDSDGTGGSLAWDSSRIGTGVVEHRVRRQLKEITQLVRSQHPFRYRGRSYWKFAERDGQTEVTWGMRGRVGFSFRAFSQTVQGMLALDHRFGLDKLACLVESANGSGAAKHYSLEYLGIRDTQPTRYVYRTYEGPLNRQAQVLPQGIANLRDELASAGGREAGEPIAVYVKTNIKLRTTVCHMGIPIDDPQFDRLPVREIPRHRAYVVRLVGSYSALEIAWYEAMQRVRIENLQPDQRIPPFERYLNDSATVPEQQRITELYIPLRDGTQSAIAPSQTAARPTS